MNARCAALLLFATPLLAQQFTAELWSGIRPVYARTLQHPFLRGLADGTLPREKFQFYLVQDRLYLRAFAQSLNILASKAPREEWAATLSRHAIDTLAEERALHDGILKSWGVSPRDAGSAEMAPSNRAYSNHILASVQALGFTEGLAAVLPCYWIYLEVGRELVRRGSKDPDYQRWIDNYSAAEYEKTVRQVLAMMDQSAQLAAPAQREEARRLFALSARYEYMFWDMAWRLEQWPPGADR
jgi:thiaminase (transcriptional activator TenA)